MSDVRNEIADIKANVRREYNLRVEKTYRLCLAYAGYFLKRYRQKQAHNEYYHNRTGDAFAGVTSGAERIKDEMIAYLMHTMDYGWPLEMANDRKHESLRPTVMAFYSRFMRDVEKVFNE